MNIKSVAIEAGKQTIAVFVAMQLIIKIPALAKLTMIGEK